MAQFVIDGSNVARNDWNEWEIEPLVGLCLALAERGDTYKVYFDAKAGHIDARVDALAKWDSSRFVLAPGGRPADEFLLPYADANGLPVVSNDLFREYRQRYPWLNDDSRRLQFAREGTTLFLPQVDLRCNFPKDTRQAIEKLKRGHEPTVRLPGRPIVSRKTPACFLFLVDQSGSMRNDAPWERERMPKAEAVAGVVNRLLAELILEATKEDGVRDYFEIGVISYNNHVSSSLPGTTIDTPLLTVSNINTIPLPMVGNVPEFLQPSARGKTRMCEALEVASRVIKRWCEAHQASYPPLVINITDGKATDGDPRDSAKIIHRAGTSFGNSMLLNICVSSDVSTPVVLPSCEDEVPDDDDAIRLFEMSSVLTNEMVFSAREYHSDVSNDARGFIYNADAFWLASLLEIGTRAARSAR